MDLKINPVSQINQDFEERDAQNKAKLWGVPYINIAKFPINPDVLKGMNQKSLVQARVLPFFRNKKRLKIAVTNPVNRETQNLLDTLKDLFEIEIHICSEQGIEKAFHIFEVAVLNKKTVQIRDSFDESKKLDLVSQLLEFQQLEEKIEKLTTKQSLNEIEITALKLRASDIHIQPSEDRVMLRFRIDGILKDITPISLEIATKIVSRIKYDSGMRSNVSDIPQDGHLSFEANGRKVDLRVSTLPTETIESVVMRVLDSRKGIKPFHELGFDDRIQQMINRVINKKTGMVLLTGPTGSGKTTTLYAMLSEVNTPEKKLVTLEDPIEYHLPNITQSQVDEKRDYNFDSGLRALLRHDPDVILIGEIRDYAVAKLATEASLTGHLVFSSLHTNSSIGAITRLRNLGVESFNIASSVNAIFAQRLVRWVCPDCSTTKKVILKDDKRLKQSIGEVVKLYPTLKSKIHKKNDDTYEVSVLKSSFDGCLKCTGTGFIGQKAICEAFELTDEIRAMISSESTEIEILNYVKEKSDFLNLFDDGIRQVLLGKTTLDEVYRVAG